MEIFNDSGHLTDEGIKALITENLDEMSRLEVAEHLSFCDSCLVRYSEKLEQCELLTPEKNIAQPVLKRIRNKGIEILLTKYVAVAAAMAFAMTLWSVGAFTNLIPVANAAENVQEQTAPILEKTNGLLSNIGEKLNDAIEGLTMPTRSKAEDNRLAEELARKREEDKIQAQRKAAQREAEYKKLAADKAAKAKQEQDKKLAEEKAARDKAMQEKKSLFTDKKADKIKNELKSIDAAFEQFKKSIF